MDINKVWISGVAVTQPLITRFTSRTPYATFVLQIQERFRDKNGENCTHHNVVRVEGLGKAAEQMVDRVREGMRYSVEGYLRSEAREDGTPGEVRVRAFSVSKDDSDESAVYLNGIRHAIKVLRKSRDLAAAIQSLEDSLSVK